MNNIQKNVVVLGGNGSLGRAIVSRLLDQQDARIWSVDREHSRIRKDPAVTLITADLRVPDELHLLRSQLPPSLSGLINTVGGESNPSVEAIEDTSWPPEAVWADIFDLNVGLPYRLVRELQACLEDGASICHVSSIAATMPWVISPAYGAAKAALEHWSRSLAVQLAPRGIRVNMVRPGFVWSRQWAAVDRAEFDNVVDDRVLLSQFDGGTATTKEQLPADVAQAVAYLVSTDARHVTGQALDIDGGASLVRAAR